MTDAKIQQLKHLKQKFWKLDSKQRESLNVCFLKCKLGVQNAREQKRVKEFVGEYPIEMNEKSVDHVINFFHSEDHSLPEFLSMEDSIKQVDTMKINPKDLPMYDMEDVDTLKEGVKKMDE